MVENEEELKSVLIEVKEESEKAGLQLNIQKTKIMAFSPITSWQIDGGKVAKVTDFVFLGSQITADGDYSHGIKRHLFLGRKAMTTLDSVLKCRDITLPNKGPSGQRYGFSRRCMGMSVSLRVVPSSTGLPSKRCPGAQICR